MAQSRKSSPSTSSGRTVLGMIALTLVMAGCSGNPPAPQPTTTPSADTARPPAGPEKLIVAFGDSLYAGYGLKPGEAWPARLEQALWARGVNARVVNAGVSGDTTAAARQRLAFVLDAQPRKPDLVAVGLGGNDMLRGLDPGEARSNLDAILGELDRRQVPALVTGMLAAPNLGPDYAARFDPIFRELAKKHGAALVPFFLEAIIAKPALLQGDHVHPTARGVEAIVADTVDDVERALANG